MKEKEVLSLLSNVGECYRKDLILAMNDKNTNESVILNRLLKLGYILESTIVCNEDSRNKIVKTLTITNKGRIRLSNILKNSYPHKIGNIVNKRFASTNPKERHIELGKSKIQLFLNQSGVRVFPQDKPSFPHIYNQVIATTYDLPNEWMYNNSIATPDTLETGVYFSLEEFYAFFNNSSLQGENDMSYGTRIKGIYLDANRTCVVYQPNYFKNRTMMFNLESVERRTLSLVLKYTQPINQVGEIDAIVLTNASALIVDMAIAGKYGKVYSQKERSFKTSTFLNVECNFFNNIYCFPHTTAGVDSLEYFRTHDQEAHKKYSLEMIESLNNFMPIKEEEIADSQLFVRDITTGNRVIFIPYFNIKQLNWLSNFYDDVSIITYPDMADSISHIIRKELSIYDISGVPLEITMYQQSGYPKGYVFTPKEKKKTRKPDYIKVAIEFPKETVEQLKTVARYNDTSMSKLIRNIIVPYAKEEYVNYEELVRLEKEKKKLLATPYKRNIKG